MAASVAPLSTVRVLAATAILALIPAQAAQAATAVALDKSAPTTQLYGTTASVNLRASNAAGADRAYNVSFRDVLPAGVSYVATTTPGAGAPTVIANQPATGQTTLLWPNLGDLSASSSYTLSYTVAHDPGVLAVGTTYTNSAGVYAQADPRILPKFTAAGAPIAASYTDSSTDSASTRLTAIEIEKDEPSAEGELLRGVHARQTVYTLTVRNNAVRATTGIAVDDYLPARLEFLGCGDIDHTTSAATNVGSSEEYPGSGPLSGHTAAPAGCTPPALVETVSLDPDGAGPLPTAVYTHLGWTAAQIGTLAVSGTRELRYVAAIPLRENTRTWTGGTAPATTGAQGANLDNNGGPSTAEVGASEPAVTNYARATGLYDGALAVEDDDTLTRTSEDLRVLKSGSSSTLAQGAVTTWTLDIATSEYRTASTIDVEDTLPDGLCPIYATTDYEGTAECATAAGTSPSPAFSTAPVEHADGTWTLAWQLYASGALGTASSTTVTFVTRTRSSYQEGGAPQSPIRANDALENHVAIDGLDATPAGIPDDEPDGVADLDESSAGQSSSGPVLDKQVGDRQSGPVDCTTATWSDGPVAHHAGDRACFRLRVTFPSNLDTGDAVVTDFLPLASTYVTGSWTALGTSTAPIDAFTSTPASGQLEWQIGSAQNVPPGGLVFDVVYAVDMTGASTTPVDLVGNLMKLSTANTAGVTFPLRDQVDVSIEHPTMELQKGIRDIDGAPAGGNGPNVASATVTGGQTVTFRVDVGNAGSLAATAVEVWDVLPDGLDCDDVVVGTISNSGTCSSAASPDRIEWSALGAAASTPIAGGSQLVLTYDVLVPTTYSPGASFANSAGVRTYTTSSNQGDVVWYPASNIDPTVTPNAARADDAATVALRALALAKAHTTSVAETGNAASARATIGETVTYTITATVPEQSVLADGEVTDTVPTSLGSVALVSATLNGTPLPTAGVSASLVGNQLDVAFPPTYANAAGDDVLVITLTGKVRDLVGTSRGTAIANTALFSGTSTPSASQTTILTVVEPVLSLAKDENDADDVVVAGQTVRYTLTLGNGTGSQANVSAAKDIAVRDVLPANIAPVDATGTPVADLGTVQPDGGVWHEADREITWSVSSLAPATSQTLRYDVKVADPLVPPNDIVNAASATATSLAGTDADERTTYAAAATDEVSVVEPSVAKSVSPTTATVGDDVLYTTTTTIPAGVRLYDATLIDDLPDGIDWVTAPAGFGQVSASCTSGCGGAVPDIAPTLLPTIADTPAAGRTRVGWFLGDVPEAAVARVVTITYRAKVDATRVSGAVEDGATLVNGARLRWNTSDLVSGTPTTIPSPTATTAVATATVTVIEPTLVIDKDVSGQVADTDARMAAPGEALTYTLTVRNTGTAPAYDVVVVDEPDAELRAVQPATVAGVAVTDGWTLADPDLRFLIDGPIAPNGTVTLTYTAELAPSSALHDADQAINTADIPSYLGVPAAERTANGFTYREYDDVTPDTVTIDVEVLTLTLAKTVGLAPYGELGDAERGQPFAWRVVVQNTSGHADALDAAVVDTLPAGWTYAPGSARLTPGGTLEPTVTGGGRTLTWSGLSLAAGATLTIVLDAIPGVDVDPAASPFTNSAAVTAEDATGATASADGPYAPAPDTAQAQVAVPELVLAKTPDGDLVPANAPGQYQVRVQNAGGAPARDVTVTDVLPVGTSYTPGDATSTVLAFAETDVQTATPSAGRTTITWTLGTLAPGASALIVVPVQVANSLADGTLLVNDAAVVSTETPTPSTDTGTLVVASAPDFADSSSKSANPSTPPDPPFTEVSPSDPITYAVRVANDGNAPATAVVVDDEIPAHTRYAAGSATAPGGVAISYRVGSTYQSSEPDDPADVLAVRFAIGSLAAGEERVLGLGVVVDAPLPDGTLIANTARVTSEETPDGTILGPVDHVVRSAFAVTATKSVSDAALDVNAEGRRLAYGVAVAVTGDAPAPDVVVEDGAPAGTTLAAVDLGDADAVTCSLDASAPRTFGACPTGAALAPVTRVRWTWGSLDPGAQPAVGFAVDVDVPAADATIANTARVGTGGDPTTDTNEVQTVVDANPVLTLAKTVSPTGEVLPGARLAYALAYGNGGTQDATGVVLADPIPAGSVYVAGSATGAAEVRVGGTWQADEPADPATVEAVRWQLGTLAMGASGSVGFQVDVDADSTDGATVANTATLVGDGLDPVEDATSTPVSAIAELAVDKHALEDAAELGQVVTYRITVVTSGQGVVPDLVVTDPLAAELELVSATDGGVLEDGVVTWRLGRVAAGASRDLLVTVRIANLPAKGSSIRNVATATADADAPPATTPTESDDDVIEVFPQGDCHLGGAVELSSTSVAVGIRRTLVATVTNGNGSRAARRAMLVRDRSGRTVATGTTDGRGRFSFTVRAGPASTAAFTVSAGGCGRATVAASRGAVCRGISVRPGELAVGERTRLAIRVASAGTPLGKVRVRVRGAGIAASGRTTARGRVWLDVRPRRAGIVRVTVPAALTCGVRLGAVAADDGDQLTG